MTSSRPEKEIVFTILTRLERISVDSHWSHRASGIRRLLLHILDQFDANLEVSEVELNHAIRTSHEILTRAAKELTEYRLIS
jgi:hypothetical protein